MQLFAAWQTDK